MAEPWAQVARLGEDDVLQALYGGRLHWGLDPGGALQHLSAGGDAQRIGAQVLVKDQHRDFHALVRLFGIGIPIGDDHAAGTVGLGQRHEGERLQAGAPEVGIDADLGDLRGGKISLRALLAAAAGPQGQAAAGRECRAEPARDRYGEGCVRQCHDGS
jgi:hypothetical protein